MSEDTKPKSSLEIAERIDNTYDNYDTDWVYHEEHGLISPWCEKGDCPCDETAGDIGVDIWGNYGVIFYCPYCRREEVMPIGNEYEEEDWFSGIRGFFRKLFKRQYFDKNAEFDKNNRVV